MTVASGVATKTLTWTGAESGFAPGFQALEAADISVTYVVGAASQLLIAGTHYAIALDGSGFVQVTPLAAMPAAPASLIFARNSSPLQAVEFADGVPPSAEGLQLVADVGALRDQEIRRDLAAAVIGVSTPDVFQVAFMAWFLSLPVVDPGVRGQPFNNGGALAVSQ